MATNNAVNSPQLTANGQLVIGGSAANGTAATLTQGTGITITNGDGSITIASSGVGSIVWNNVSGTTQTAAVNQGYIISNASQTTVTIPNTVAQGSVFAVAGLGTAGWKIQMGTGQVCNVGSSPTTTAGTITSTNRYDSITILCVTANTTFIAIAGWGNLTIA